MRLTDIVPEEQKEEGTRLSEAIQRFLRDYGRVPEGPLNLMVGDWSNRPRLQHQYKRLGWGRMFVTSTPDPYPGESWGLDNGAWSAWTQGRGFPAEQFQERVSKAREVAEETGCPPAIAIAPDKLMAGAESLDFSLHWLMICRDLAPDFPWYLPVQPGMDPERVEEAVESFDGLLLGGAGEMKPSGRLWRGVARRAGVRFHYPQVATRSRLFHAADLGAETADTAMPMFRVGDMRKFLGWWVRLCEAHAEG